MPTFETNNVTVNYTDSGGDGQPVVLIHGWPLSGASWSEQVGALTDAGYRVITYDRRGFGESTPSPESAYDYDALASDLAGLLEHLDVRGATLVGFSMGGGEVARYVGTYGTDRLASVVFAAAIPPWLLKSDDNPDGSMPRADAEGMQGQLRADREGFFDQFTTNFFSVDGELKVSEDQRQQALALTRQADLDAATSCISSWLTDFTSDIAGIDVPTLIIHGDSDAIVPVEVSGQRVHDQVDGSELVIIKGGPHGINTSHASEFNEALLAFLAK